MRRKDREITDFDRKLAVLQRCEVLHLGLSDDAAPYVVPLNFGVRAEDGSVSLYFHCAASGRKLDLLRKNPRISFAADRVLRLVSAERPCDWTMKYECAMGEGTAALVEDPAEKSEGMLCILRHYGYEGGAEFPSPMMERTAIFRIRVSSFTAKSNESEL